MIGILVTFLLSWLLLRATVREPLTVLGIVPNQRRIVEFLAGMLFMAVIAVINFTWQAHFKEIGYQVNPDYELSQMLSGSFWILRAVIFEELLFRGAILYEVGLPGKVDNGNDCHEQHSSKKFHYSALIWNDAQHGKWFAYGCPKQEPRKKECNQNTNH